MLSEAAWSRLAPLLPPQKNWSGRPSLDHRRFIEAVLWLCMPRDRETAPRRRLSPSRLISVGHHLILGLGRGPSPGRLYGAQPRGGRIMVDIWLPVLIGAVLPAAI